MVVVGRCDVEWKEGNDVTVDKEGTKKDSFFNFFKPPVIDDEGALSKRVMGDGGRLMGEWWTVDG